MKKRRCVIVYADATTKEYSTDETGWPGGFEIIWEESIQCITFYLNDIEVGSVYHQSTE